MATMPAEMLERLFLDWTASNIVHDIPGSELWLGMRFERWLHRVEPRTDDMRQMMDDIGIEPGLEIEPVAIRNVYRW